MGDAKHSWPLSMAGYEKLSLKNVTGGGFTRGGERRGKTQENVAPQAAICDVFCDL